MAKFTTDEKVSLLLKKNLGKPSTDTGIEFYVEPSIDARPRVFTSQIFSNDIPTTRPTSGWRVEGSESSYSDFSTFSSLSPGDVLEHEDGVLKYYFKLSMAKVTNGNDTSFQVDGTNHLEGSIPFNFDSGGGYGVKIYRYDDNTQQIFDGTGEWVVDSDAGILTFYHQEDVSSYVSESKPPFISFFSYVGTKGLDQISPWTQVSDGIKYNEASKTVLIGRDASSSSGTFDLEVEGDSKFHSTIHAQQVICSSDMKLKKNICVIEDPTKKLMEVRGVSFRWKQNDQISFGCIADEFEQILPGSVQLRQDGVKGLDYHSAIALLIECVKEQGKRIDHLHEKIKAYERNTFS